MESLLEKSTKEIKERKEKLINKLKVLADDVNEYMEQNSSVEKENILFRYKEIKLEVKNEAKYLKTKCVMNKMLDKSEEHNLYAWGIMEAAACGFQTKVNGKIDIEMYESIQEAISKLENY